jgi:DNA repair exonuclease SbcCD ATPase subunit
MRPHPQTLEQAQQAALVLEEKMEEGIQTIKSILTGEEPETTQPPSRPHRRHRPRQDESAEDEEKRRRLYREVLQSWEDLIEAIRAFAPEGSRISDLLTEVAGSIEPLRKDRIPQLESKDKDIEALQKLIRHLQQEREGDQRSTKAEQERRDRELKLKEEQLQATQGREREANSKLAEWKEFGDPVANRKKLAELEQWRLLGRRDEVQAKLTRADTRSKLQEELDQVTQAKAQLEKDLRKAQDELKALQGKGDVEGLKAELDKAKQELEELRKRSQSVQQEYDAFCDWASSEIETLQATKPGS